MTTSSSTSPCAACKFLRRKCEAGCVFAPYFPPDQPQKFASVHRVFGASNVAKLLNEIHPSQREDAVNSLAFEADMRLRDPVYGCVGVISLLQLQLRQLQFEISNARSQLLRYHHLGGGNSSGSGGGGALLHHHHHHNQYNLHLGHQHYCSDGADENSGGNQTDCHHHHQEDDYDS